MNSETKFDARECADCVNRAARKGNGAPCAEIYEYAKKRRRPVIRADFSTEIGNSCPFTRPWEEFYAIVGGKGAWDGDKYAITTVGQILRKVRDDPIYTYPDMKSRATGRAGSYVLDEETRRWGYRDADRNLRPIITMNPSNHAIASLMENKFYNTIVANPKSTWIGFALRAGSGAGVSKEKSDGVETLNAVIYNSRKMLDDAVEPHTFSALIERQDVKGFDAATSIIFVYITGLDSIGQLSGTRFSGSDWTVAFVANFKAIQNLGKARKLGSIAKRLILEKATIQAWEKAELLSTAARWGSNASSTMSQGKSINLIDVGAGVAVGISYSDWTGVVTSVDGE